MNYFVLAALWIIWCAVHSAMISKTLTDYLKHRIGAWFRFYRLFYNLVAIATLIPVGLYSYHMQSQVIFRWEGYLRLCQIFMLATVALLFFAGARHYSMLQILGIRQIKEGATHSVLTESGELDTSGILGMTRHPWYAAAIILIWLRNSDVSAIIINIILSSYLVIGTFLEERKLLLEFGGNYRNYQKYVSMLIPYKWLKSKIKVY